MGLAVTIQSRGAGGEAYRILIEKTLPDRGLIRVQGWPADIGTGGPPTSDETVQLYDIRTLSPAELCCRGNVLGPDPVISCRLLREGDAARVEVEVNGTLFGQFDGLKVYPVSKADLEDLRAFFSRAAFPPA